MDSYIIQKINASFKNKYFYKTNVIYKTSTIYNDNDLYSTSNAYFYLIEDMSSYPNLNEQFTEKYSIIST